MPKTYYPGAYLVAYRAHRYLTRYQTQLAAGATTTQAAALVTIVAALAAFIADWPKPNVDP
jgi:hypothetical protein